MQTSTVALVSTRALMRSVVSRPPPGMASAPMRRAASNPAQNPMNGPKENAEKMRSPAPTPAARYTNVQQRVHQSHDSAVSSHRIGRPVVPEVWWTRT